MYFFILFLMAPTVNVLFFYIIIDTFRYLLKYLKFCSIMMMVSFCIATLIITITTPWFNVTFIRNINTMSQTKSDILNTIVFYQYKFRFNNFVYIYIKTPNIYLTKWCYSTWSPMWSPYKYNFIWFLY